MRSPVDRPVFEVIELSVGGVPDALLIGQRKAESSDRPVHRVVFGADVAVNFVHAERRMVIDRAAFVTAPEPDADPFVSARRRAAPRHEGRGLRIDLREGSDGDLRSMRCGLERAVRIDVAVSHNVSHRRSQSYSRSALIH